MSFRVALCVCCLLCLFERKHVWHNTPNPNFLFDGQWTAFPRLPKGIRTRMGRRRLFHNARQWDFAQSRSQVTIDQRHDQVHSITSTDSHPHTRTHITQSSGNALSSLSVPHSRIVRMVASKDDTTAAPSWPLIRLLPEGQM